MQKGGDEGVQCHHISDKSLLNALKCDDGNMAASQAMMAALLLQHAAPDAHQAEVLHTIARQTISNVRGLDVGEMRAVM
jgi:L-asparaginase II